MSLGKTSRGVDRQTDRQSEICEGEWKQRIGWLYYIDVNTLSCLLILTTPLIFLQADEVLNSLFWTNWTPRLVSPVPSAIITESFGKFRTRIPSSFTAVLEMLSFDRARQQFKHDRNSFVTLVRDTFNVARYLKSKIKKKES